MDRPLITFLTDFGPDAAAAICRGVMLSIARDAQIVDISHLVRKFAIREGAYLLWMSLPWMPIGIHVAIVDPGVGTARRPIGIRTGRGDVLIGPDNGLLVPAAERLGGIGEVRLLANRDWMLPSPSSTFHGRDIFAPMAARIAAGGPFESVGPIVPTSSIVALAFPAPVVRDGELDTSVIYIDSFGNLRLAGEPDDLLDAVGEIESGSLLQLKFGGRDGEPAVVETATWARTFGNLPTGAALLYEDSSGRLAVGHNQADAAAALGVEPGQSVQIERRGS